MSIIAKKISAISAQSYRCEPLIIALEYGLYTRLRALHAYDGLKKVFRESFWAPTKMHDSPIRAYFRNIWQTVYTILVGMRITLKYCFAKTVTLQYPDVAPALQPRYRGFHFFEIEKCIACDLCAKACPVDCIYIDKTGPRKIDKETGIAKGGQMTRYAIDYAKCMFCALCVDPCPTDCIHMGNLHDLSGYDRESMIVEFTELAKEGLQTPQPLWMQKDKLPDWAQKRKEEWIEFNHSQDKLTDDKQRRREEMVKAVADAAE